MIPYAYRHGHHRQQPPDLADPHATPLAEKLADRGHTATIYSPVNSDGETADDTARGRCPGPVRLEPVPVGTAEDSEMPARYGAFLEHQWRSGRPDVAHAFCWNAGLAALSSATDAQVPLVQDYRADTDPPPGVDAEKWWRLEVALGRHAQRSLVSGRSQGAELARRGVPHDAMSVVPFGVDTDMFTADGAARLRTDRSRLVCADGVTNGHGAEEVIRALPRLAGVELLIAGGPPGDQVDEDPAAEELRQLAAALDVAERVRFLGELPPTELAALFRSADLVLSVATHAATAQTCLQAMACETPIVATAVEARADVVVDGVSGALVPAGDTDRLGDTVRGLLRDTPRRLAYGIAGADRARSCYSWDRVADAAETAYTSAVRSGVFTGADIAGTYHAKAG